MNHLPYVCHGVNSVEVLLTHKGVDPKHLSWKGVAVATRGESAKDMWISRNRWLSEGFKTLREKAPFPV